MTPISHGATGLPKLLPGIGISGRIMACLIGISVIILAVSAIAISSFGELKKKKRKNVK